MGSAADRSSEASDPPAPSRLDGGAGRWQGPRAVLVWAVVTPVLFFLLPRIPGPGPIELDAFLGFGVGLVPVVVLVWAVARGRMSARRAGILTGAVVERAPVFLDYLLVHFPVLGRPGTGMGLGMSDVIFLALFAAGSAQAGLRSTGGFVVMTCSLLVTVALALLWKPALPALPLLSIAFLVANADLLVAAARRGRKV